MQQSVAAAIGPAPVVDFARRGPETTLPDLYQSVVRKSGLGPLQLAKLFAHLSFGPGKLSFDDFVRLRLYDAEVRATSEPRAYVGQRRNRNLCVEANHRHDWLGLLTNKIASLSYLQAYGFPTIPANVIYVPGLRTKPNSPVADRESLIQYLKTPEHFPLFGKPVESFQSLGSLALKTCHPDTMELERIDGVRFDLEPFIDQITTNYPAGYLFQPLVGAHPEIANVCGPRLATVRIITTLAEEGPRVFRTAWKILGGGNAADNFWRPGNLLAQIDRDSGRVGRVLSGTGIGALSHTHHPDTGATLTGFTHPQWNAMRSLALEAAALMRHVPLIGWDIACTPEGPVIVEMNETPDFFLVQFADQQGVLGEELDTFLAFQRAQKNAFAKRSAAAIAKL